MNQRINFNLKLFHLYSKGGNSQFAARWWHGRSEDEIYLRSPVQERNDSALILNECNQHCIQTNVLHESRSYTEKQKQRTKNGSRKFICLKSIFCKIKCMIENLLKADFL